MCWFSPTSRLCGPRVSGIVVEPCGFHCKPINKRLGILAGMWDPQMEGGDLTHDLLTFVVELCGHVNLTVGVEESLEERNRAIDVVEENYTLYKYVQVQCVIHLPLFGLFTVFFTQATEMYRMSHEH